MFAGRVLRQTYCPAVAVAGFLIAKGPIKITPPSCDSSFGKVLPGGIPGTITSPSILYSTGLNTTLPTSNEDLSVRRQQEPGIVEDLYRIFYKLV
jgi:hypothetical protein